MLYQAKTFLLVLTCASLARAQTIDWGVAAEDPLARVRMAASPESGSSVPLAVYAAMGQQEQRGFLWVSAAKLAVAWKADEWPAFVAATRPANNFLMAWLIVEHLPRKGSELMKPPPLFEKTLDVITPPKEAGSRDGVAASASAHAFIISTDWLGAFYSGTCFGNHAEAVSYLSQGSSNQLLAGAAHFLRDAPPRVLNHENILRLIDKKSKLADADLLTQSLSVLAWRSGKLSDAQKTKIACHVLRGWDCQEKSDVLAWLVTNPGSGEWLPIIECFSNAFREETVSGLIRLLEARWEHAHVREWVTYRARAGCSLCVSVSNRLRNK
jgi:hypothetical protein